MKKRDLYWAAGVLEGEGTFHVSHDARGYGRSRIGLQMTDPDIVLKVAEVFAPYGRVLGPYQPSDNRKQVMLWNVSAHVHVLVVAEMLYPLMGARRQGQLDTVIEFAKSRLGLE